MIVRILHDQHIRLDTAAGDEGLEIDGDHFGPLQMLATSVALCTASAVQAYAETAKLDLHGFGVELQWEYVEDPYRVGSYALTLHLPDTLPAARQRAVQRAADTCTVSNTLLHSPTITTTLATYDPAAIQIDTQHHHHHHHYEPDEAGMAADELDHGHDHQA